MRVWICYFFIKRGDINFVLESCVSENSIWSQPQPDTNPTPTRQKQNTRPANRQNNYSTHSPTCCCQNIFSGPQPQANLTYFDPHLNRTWETSTRILTRTRNKSKMNRALLQLRKVIYNLFYIEKCTNIYSLKIKCNKTTE